jgi:hypothetical protein
LKHGVLSTIQLAPTKEEGLKSVRVQFEFKEMDWLS